MRNYRPKWSLFNFKIFLLTDLRERTVGEALSHTSKKVVGLFNPGLGHVWEATDEYSSLSTFLSL